MTKIATMPIYGKKPSEGALLAWYSARLFDHKVAGLNLTRGAVLSLSKTLHRHCVVLVQPRKTSRYV